MNGSQLYLSQEDDDGSLDVTQALLYIAALAACCFAPPLIRDVSVSWAYCLLPYYTLLHFGR